MSLFFPTHAEAFPCKCQQFTETLNNQQLHSPHPTKDLHFLLWLSKVTQGFPPICGKWNGNARSREDYTQGHSSPWLKWGVWGAPLWIIFLKKKKKKVILARPPPQQTSLWAACTTYHRPNATLTSSSNTLWPPAVMLKYWLWTSSKYPGNSKDSAMSSTCRDTGFQEKSLMDFIKGKRRDLGSPFPAVGLKHPNKHSLNICSKG